MTHCQILNVTWLIVNCTIIHCQFNNATWLIVTCHTTCSISGSNAIPSRTHNSHDSCTCISLYTVWHDSCPDLFPAATQYHRARTWLIIWSISVWDNSRQVTCHITWSISGSNSMPSGTDIWHDSCVSSISLPYLFLATILQRQILREILRELHDWRPHLFEYHFTNLIVLVYYYNSVSLLMKYSRLAYWFNQLFLT